MPWWGRVLLTLWGLSVSLSRVALGIHFIGDVVAGLLSGMVMGLLLLSNKRF
jgi:membrane-associated phospholipid phosphatase